ncbi:hypothetical protein QZM35_12415 [Burkholderia sp. AU45274]|uniref:hypothetical protein n=1 Tax=Burkholderia sp. AU45274 TaxID=3059205 RepID=UPI00264C00DD|nr:hypothetical protein [Burkholderia sp. AU45274]MDN7488503.1 hypothetical protein [Burkholderia sp. AU45274]
MTVTAAIAGLKNTIDLAKAAIATRDELKLAEMQQSINDRVIDVQNAALALQEKQSAARDEIDQLKEELRKAKTTLAELERTQSEREKYALHAVSEGALVYALKSDYVDQGVPSHFLCQPCFDGPEKRKVILEYTPGQKAGQYVIHPRWSCPVCKHGVNERK